MASRLLEVDFSRYQKFTSLPSYEQIINITVNEIDTCFEKISTGNRSELLVYIIRCAEKLLGHPDGKQYIQLLTEKVVQLTLSTQATNFPNRSRIENSLLKCVIIILKTNASPRAYNLFKKTFFNEEHKYK